MIVRLSLVYIAERFGVSESTRIYGLCERTRGHTVESSRAIFALMLESVCVFF